MVRMRRKIYTAFGNVFPFAVYLLCDIHMEDNIMRKLADLGIQTSLAHEFKKEIFGRNSGAVREPGPVDCLTKKDFKKQLGPLGPVWKERHAKGKQFYEYFVRHKAPLILSCMGAATRMMAGLGYPPDVYTQNGSECGNFILKHDKTKESLGMVECVELIRKVVERQETMEYLAMCGQGEWFLDNRYASKQLEETAFYSMTDDQKKEPLTYVLEPDKSNVLEQASISENPALTSGYSAISIAPENTNILHVPFPKLKDIFSKATQILSCSERDIHRFGDEAMYVASKSSPQNPHKVLHKDMGSSPATALV